MTADVTRSSSVSMELRMERETPSIQDDSVHNSIIPRVEMEPDGRITGRDLPLIVAPLATNGDDAVSIATASTSPHQRGRKRKASALDGDDCDGTAELANDGSSRLESAADIGDDVHPLVQINKKRCFACNCRMDLAIREIGKCKCEYIFCALHRLPEQHNCTFDHKEHCRQEARAKMVVLRKHVGTSLKRLDSDS